MKGHRKLHVLFLAALALSIMPYAVPGQDADAPSDAAAWGEDHVGKPLPQYITGDECLFCHRNDIGPTWPDNRHARTIRFADPEDPAINKLKENEEFRALAEETIHLLGRDNRVRYLKPAAAYGHLDLAHVEYQPAHDGSDAKLVNADKKGWDSETFANGCVGCHATAIETKTKAFAASSLDCFSCHGSVSLEHTSDTKVMLLSQKRRDPPEIVASICGQCHLRGGRSKASGLPYANQFVAGDNLFKDWEVDLKPETIAAMDPGERHVFENIRAIVLGGESRTTCLSCHEVHLNKSDRHVSLAEREYCFICHVKGEPISKKVIPYERHSAICGY